MKNIDEEGTKEFIGFKLEDKMGREIMNNRIFRGKAECKESNSRQSKINQKGEHEIQVHHKFWERLVLINGKIVKFYLTM